jgi:hypothetical protein
LLSAYFKSTLVAESSTDQFACLGDAEFPRLADTDVRHARYFSGVDERFQNAGTGAARKAAMVAPS